MGEIDKERYGKKEEEKGKVKERTTDCDVQM